MTTIDTIKNILGHRIEGDPVRSGKWLVWRCTKSPQTMDKFVGRVRDEGATCFCRDGKFGVLADDIGDAAEARSELQSNFR